MWKVSCLVEEDRVLMLCRQWRGSDLVEGCCEHEYPLGPESLQIVLLASVLLLRRRVAGPKA
jgi:hypothetical protein